jgi:hypothetical protein
MERGLDAPRFKIIESRLARRQAPDLPDHPSNALEVEDQTLRVLLWSGERESNPHHRLGRPKLYH